MLFCNENQFSFSTFAGDDMKKEREEEEEEKRLRRVGCEAKAISLAINCSWVQLTTTCPVPLQPSENG